MEGVSLPMSMLDPIGNDTCMMLSISSSGSPISGRAFPEGHEKGELSTKDRSVELERLAAVAVEIEGRC